jgi:xylulose-5-phosphate/fructose-6-phosphate phosphoketolase
MHQMMAATLDAVLAAIHAIQHEARASSAGTLPVWPMIVLRTPKGWTGPKIGDGKPVEGTWRAHQVPVADLENPEHLKILENWMKSYEPRPFLSAPKISSSGKCGRLPTS